MPIFDYYCKDCGNEKEEIANKDEIVFCDCGSEMSKNKIQKKTTFILKGEGWYITDYKDNE